MSEKKENILEIWMEKRKVNKEEIEDFWAEKIGEILAEKIPDIEERKAFVRRMKKRQD